MFGEYQQKVKDQAPLIHCITNYVTVNDVANAVLAAGASPIMADDDREVEDIQSIASGLDINIGTLNARTISSMHKAGKKAMELHHALVLDLVGAGASHLRTETAMNLLKDLHFDVIRGNVSEIRTLANGTGNTKGVDASAGDSVTEENLDAMISFVKSFSKDTGSVIAMSGAIDLVSDAHTCYVIRNGRREMSRITGTGCQLSALTAAYVASDHEHPLEATAAAFVEMGLAGEIGWENMKEEDGNATYRNRIIDAIYNMTTERMEMGEKYEIR